MEDKHNILQNLSSKLHDYIYSHQPENEYISNRQTELVNPIRIFLNFMYYLGGSPFRCVRSDEQSRYFKRKFWRPQQVVCAVLHILCIFRLISSLREAVLPINSSPLLKNPTPYFDIVLKCCAFFYKTVIMKRLWFNYDEYVHVLNTIENETQLPVRNYWILKAGFQNAFYGFFVLKLLTRVFCGYGFVTPISSWTPTWWLRRLVGLSRVVFCFSQPPMSMDAPELSSITVGDGFLAFLMLLTSYARYRLLFSEFCDLFILSFTLTLWTTSASFSSDIKDILMIATLNEENNWAKCSNKVSTSIPVIPVIPSVKEQENLVGQNWSKIYGNFQTIQSLSEKINVTLGSQVIWYLAEQLFYFSIYLNVIFISRDIFVKLNGAVFLTVTFHILYLSADICNQMASAKSWLVKKNHTKSVPFDEANIVLHETIAKDIGIRGNNSFTITFSMVATYLSLIVTFFVICVQESDVKAQTAS